MKLSQKRQALINNFFAPKGQKPQKFQRTTQIVTPPKPLKRSDSVLSQSFGNGFDEISDTSMESPEIKNFKSPVIRKIQKSTTRLAPGAARPLGEGPLEAGTKRFKYDLASQASKPVTVPDTTRVQLSREQMVVISEIVDRRKNVFYTGSAGTGKSVVLRELVYRLYSLYGAELVGVTASTGLAACNIGGQTIHRFLGIGLGQAPVITLHKSIEKKAAVKRKWEQLKVLIIDEISMVDGILFTKLNELAKMVRGNNLPFGGIQVVCTGDFFQLPPVNKGGEAKYCFESPAWRDVIHKTLVLTRVFRQQGDNTLIDMLNSLRFGDLESSIISKFYELQKPKTYDDGIEPTELYPLREEVKRANDRRIKELPHEARIFKAMDNVDNEMEERQLDNLMCEKVLTLKPGAQVMYLKNRSDNIINGSLGKVLFFATDELFKGLLSLFSLTPYHIDASTMQYIHIVTSRIGKQDVPLTDEEVVLIDQLQDSQRATMDTLLKFASESRSIDVCPVVDFKDKNGISNIIFVEPEEFSIEIGTIKKKTITRTQLPLLLAWAMSIHKSQGQTIPRLRVDLRKIFEKGQVYVALSRAINKEGLEIRNFDPKRIIASEKVKEFYNQLETI